MKLALILLLAPLLPAQIFSPPGAVRRYAGTPTAGDCTASAIGRRAVDYSAIPSAHYKCSQTSSGVYEWEAEGSGAGGSGDITSVTAGTGLTGGGTSGAVTLALATVTASRALASDSSGYPAATSVTATELGYLSGVTGAIQTQLGTKATIGTIGTAGRNVYVSGSSTITEDASFTRGATGQYTLYDATGPNTFTVRSGSAQSTARAIELTNSSGTSPVGFRHDSGTGRLIFRDGTTDSLRFSSFGVEIPGGSQIFFGSSGSFNADVGAARSSSGNVAITNASSTNYWTLGAGGILAGTDNAYDIGASGANRPRNVFIAGYSLTSGVIYAGSSLAFGSGATSVINGSGTNGRIVISNAAGTDFGLLQFGGTSNSFNAIGRDAVNGFTIQSAAGTATYNDASTSASGTVTSRYLFGIAAPTLTATNSSVTYTTASTLRIGGAPTASTNVTIGTPYALEVAAGASYFGGSVSVIGAVAASVGLSLGPSNNYIQSTKTGGDLQLLNAAGNGFGLLQFGGTTSSFPALKRSTTGLAVRLADDSADAPITASNVTASSDFIGSSTSCLYLGATGTDGSWRFCRSSNDLVVSRRESGSWVAKGTWAP